jgi:GMP synthase-like glutamine amidotransferase
MPLKPLLAIQNTWEDPPGLLSDIMQTHNIACEVVEAETQPLPTMLTDYQAIIVMGGPQHVYTLDEHPFLRDEITFLQRAVVAKIPILGICLGGQLLAAALGAEVSKHHLTELGFFRIPLTDDGLIDPLFAGLPGFQCALHWHGDVFTLPAGAVQLASNKNAPQQAFRWGKQTYGLQYHIELTDEMMHTWLQFTEEIVRVLGNDDAPTILAEEWEKQKEMYYEHSRLLFENFLQIAGVALYDSTTTEASSVTTSAGALHNDEG